LLIDFIVYVSAIRQSDAIIKMILNRDFLYIIYFIVSFNKMNREAQLAIFAVVAALGILDVIAIESVMTVQEAKGAGHGFPGC
jgi:hypothetical protein